MKIDPQDVSIISITWGDYWTKYGKDFLHNLSKLDSPPGETIIGTQYPLLLPKNIRQITIKEPYKWDSLNQVAKKVTKKWILPIAIDDCLLQSALDSLSTSCEIIRFSYVASNGTLLYPNPRKYLHMDNYIEYPIPGGMLIKTKIFIKYKVRNAHYSDWIQALELHKNKIKTDFDFTPRITHRIHDNQHSAQTSDEGIKEIKYFLTLLKNKNIKILNGNEWPPIYRLRRSYLLSRKKQNLMYKILIALRKRNIFL